MHYILFNPLSKKGQSKEVLNKLETMLIQDGITYQVYDVLTLRDQVNDAVKGLQPNDAVIIVGGDGTLHHITNQLRDFELKNKFYLYRAGTGNDFSREFKQKESLLDITEYITGLPFFQIEEKTTTFLNCAGMGIDANVCVVMNEGEKPKGGISYFITAIKTFLRFKRFDLKVEVDGVCYHFRKVYFATVMNGKYFGGGMKLAPEAIRNDEILNIYIIHRIPLWKLFFIFPLIFFGKHIHFKKHGIVTLQGKEISFQALSPQYFQADGETISNVESVKFSGKYQR